MIKSLVAATLALTMVTTAAMSQTSSSSSATTTQTTIPAPVPAETTTTGTATQRTTNMNGVVTDQTKAMGSSTTISPSGDTTATKKSTETTTVR